jgi:hypothetical protein
LVVASEWRKTASEARSGFTQAPVLVVTSISLGLFVVTGAVWLVAHLNNWPGGYLPWMLSLAFLLLSVAFFLNFHQMRLQRDAARRELSERVSDVPYSVNLESVKADYFYPHTKDDPVRSYIFYVGLQNVASVPVRVEMGDRSLELTDHDQRVQPSKAPPPHVLLPGKSINFPLAATADLTQSNLVRARAHCVFLYGHPSGDEKFRCVMDFDLWPRGFDDEGWPTVWIYMLTDEIKYEKVGP